MKKKSLLVTSTLLLGIASLTYLQTRAPVGPVEAEPGVRYPEKVSSAAESGGAEPVAIAAAETSAVPQVVGNAGSSADLPLPAPIRPRTWDAENLSGVELANIPYGVGRVDEVVFEEIAPADERGLVRRTRVLKTNFKYPYVQTVELLGPEGANGDESIVAYAAMVADHVMVQVEPEKAPDGWRETLARAGLGIRREVTKDGLYLMDFPLEAAGGTFDVIDALETQLDWVSYAEPDFILTALATDDEEEVVPNDPLYESTWGLSNTGQFGGIAGYDINAHEAWQIRTDASDVIVAVVDSGIDFEHPDLRANMWVNPREIPGNGRDDDGNGYIDDIHGVDPFTGGTPEDFDGHGTHVAGTIGAVGNNQRGVAGVAWNVQLMAVRIIGPFGGTMADMVQGIDYAWENGATILNNSWGMILINARLLGDWRPQSMADAILRTRNAGAIFVAAAGNDTSNLDIYPDYPTWFLDQADNVVNVAAYDSAGQLAVFSNYGVNNVHIAAPGVDILSTWPGGTYNAISGTSMAAPHIAGVLALLRAEFPHESYRQTIQRLYQTSVKDPHFSQTVRGGRRVDLAAALNPSPLVYEPVRYVPDVGGAGVLTVGATGKGDLTYQWFRNDVAVEGATGPVLQLEDAGPFSGGVYRVEIASDYGATSSQTRVLSSLGNTDLGEALGEPGLTWRSSDDAPWTSAGEKGARSGLLGRNGTSALSAIVAGPGEITFSWKVSSEWRRDTLRFAIGEDVKETISGEFGWVERTYAIPVGTHALSWVYSKDGGTDVGMDTGWVKQVTYTPAHPMIDSITRPGQLVVGAGVTLEVQARGPGLTYTWFKDGERLVDQRGPVLSLANIDFEDAGAYEVTVANPFGAATRTVRLDVVGEFLPPVILYDPRDIIAEPGQPVVLWADFEATGPWRVSWFKDGEVLEGREEAYLNLGGLQAEEVGRYTYAVSNAAGTATSLPITVALTPPTETFDEWLERFGGREAVERAIGGGIDPLLLYALGIVPGKPVTDNLPRAAVVPGVRFSLLGEGDQAAPPADHLALVFERPISTKGVDYVLEASADLSTWEAVEATVEVSPLEGSARELVRLREIAPIPENAERRFLRMRIKTGK